MTNSERQKRYRDRQKALRSGGIVTENGESVTAGERNVTETDRKFMELKPEYYLFEDGEAWERKCWRCGADYSTRLELNKFCSPRCKEKYLREAFRAKPSPVSV